jgi:4-diphosphocytidyl-2-C-methyl-D-erythritol kinase
LVVFPPAKINIGLSIKQKRTDGFHEIESYFVPTPWCDVLEIIKAEKLEITITGLPIYGLLENNLCLKAYHLLKNDFDVITPVHIYLHKHIPLGAGLGGGSADGTYTLLALNKLFNLNLNQDQLLPYAAALGSDCPFFIYNQPMQVTGRGEILKPINLSLKGLYIYLIKPKFSINTTQAFTNLYKYPRQEPKPAPGISMENLSDWSSMFVNDFEFGINQQHPEINELKNQLYNVGASYCSMSGSGSTVYGIFTHKPKTIIDLPLGYISFIGKW